MADQHILMKLSYAYAYLILPNQNGRSDSAELMQGPVSRQAQHLSSHVARWRSRLADFLTRKFVLQSYKHASNDMLLTVVGSVGSLEFLPFVKVVSVHTRNKPRGIWDAVTGPPRH